MPEPTSPRTFSSWIFIAAFTVLAIVGIVAFVGGGGVTGTRTLDTPRTALAADTDTGDGIGDGETSDQPAGQVPVEDVSAEDVPEGATLQRDGAASSYSFPAPDSLDGADTELRVEIASATAAATDSSLSVTVACTHSADEHLGQIIVNEGTSVVTVVPLVIVPADGDPCVGGVEGTQQTFSLTSPIGDRTVVVIPVGTPIPEGANLLQG